MADLLQEMSKRLHAGGNIFSGDLVAGDRFSANQQTLERARNPKIIRRELLAGFLRAIFVGVVGDHVPFPRSELYSCRASANTVMTSTARRKLCGCFTSVGREPLKRARAPLGIDELDLLVGIRGEHPSPERECGSVVRRLGHLPGPTMAVNHQVGGLSTQ